MTFEELKKLYNIFGIKVEMTDDEITFYDLINDMPLQTYKVVYTALALSIKEEIPTSKKSDLLNGYRFKAANDVLSCEIKIKYNSELDKYYEILSYINDLKEESLKIVHYEYDANYGYDVNYERLEYFMKPDRAYDYTVVLTKSRDNEWKQVYFDELDCNKELRLIYSASGTPDKYEIDDNLDTLDYERLCNDDPFIEEVINYFAPEVKSFLPEASWKKDASQANKKVLVPNNNEERNE